MANYNLTSQQLKDTYQQLVQVSGSAIVDGTGSLVNAFDYPSNSAYTTFSSSVASTLNTIVAGSGSADWTLITNKPAGLVSGSTQVNYLQLQNIPSGILSSSAQIATDISGAFTSTSASLAAGIATNKSDITTKLNTSTFTSYSASAAVRFTTNETDIANNTLDIATQTSRVDSLVAATSSYAVKNSNNTFSGTQTFDNIAVNGTASIAHVQTVTGSAVIIGEEFIILNAATPAARYAGIKIYDTGSGAPATASLEWDGVQDTWIIMEESGDTAVILTGMTGSRGSEALPTTNRVQKGGGFNQLTDSNISDDGSQVSITGPVSASTYYGDGSNLTGVSSGLVLGSTATSLQSALTTTPAVAAASYSIAIGNNVTVESGSTGMIAIGSDINGSFTNRDYSVAIGAAVVLENNGLEAVAIGSSSRGEDYTVAVGAQASGTGYAVAVGKNARAGSDYSIAIGANVNSTSAGTNPSTIAIGKDSQATAANAIAIGEGIIVGGTRTIGIGYNLSAGSGLNSSNTVCIGYNGSANVSNAVAIGFEAYCGQSNTVAIGNTAEANGVNSVALGDAITNNTNTVAIGIAETANGDESIAIGTAHNANGDYSIAIGRRGGVSGEAAVGIGNFTTTNGNHAIAIGNTATATAANTIAIGSASVASSANEINIGDRFKFDGTSTISLIGQVSSSLGFVGNGSGLTNITATSASYAQTSSFAAGNFEVAGQMFSPTFAGSVASSTSSIDFDNGNFATLSLTVPTFLASPSNLKSGTTYTIIISSGSLIANHGSAFKFAGGTSPTYSNGTDVLTMVSDGTNLYATALTDFQ
jgi:hypothetical protein